MRFIKTMLILLWALVWAPLAAHCQLEVATGAHFLSCELRGAAPSDPLSHCHDTGCCAWESGHYQLPQNQAPINPIFLAVISSARITDLDDDLSPCMSVVRLTPAPPELQTSWRFFFRTALPVRAPSLAS